MSFFFDQVAQLQNDIDALDAILGGSENATVNVNGVQKDTISKAIKDRFSAIQAQVQGALAFETKQEMIDAGAPPNGELAKVWNDPTTGNNGLYGYSGGVWVKSPYDPETYVDTTVASQAFARAPWANIDTILNDAAGDFTASMEGGTAVAAPAGWPAGLNVAEVTNTSGNTTQCAIQIFSEGGGRYELSDYAGQYLDVVILAELGALRHVSSSETDFWSLGLVLNNDTQYPEVQAFFSRQINGTVSEFRATVAVDDILATYPNARILNARVRFKGTGVGTVRWGAPRVAFGPAPDRAFFDQVYSNVASREELETLAADTDAQLAALTDSLPDLVLEATTQIEVLYSDVSGSDLGSMTQVGAESLSVDDAPAGWPLAVQKVATITSDGGSTASIAHYLSDGPGVRTQMEPYAGQYINFRYLVDTDLDLDTAFYRTGLLFISDSGYPKADISEKKLLGGNLYQVSGTVAVDDILAGHTNVRLDAFSPQIKPAYSGYFTCSALRIAIGDSPNTHDYTHSYTLHERTASAQRVTAVEADVAGLQTSVGQASSDAAAALAASGANPYKRRLRDSILLGDWARDTDADLATVSISGTTPSITNAVTVNRNSDAVQYLFGQVITPVGANYPKTLLTGTRSVTYADDTDLQYDTSANVWGMEFCYFGTELEIGIATNPLVRPLFVEVDGVLVSETPLNLNTGSVTEHVIHLQFASLKKHRVRLVSPGGTYIFNLYREPTGLLSRYVPAVDSLGVVIGDSFTEGSNSTQPIYKYGYTLGKLLNIHNMVVSGSGGTGYLKKIAHHSGGQRLNALERISDVYNPLGTGQVPDFVVFCMGINDGSLDDALVAANARACYDAVRAQSAEVPIFVVGPFTATENSYNTSLAAAIETEVAATPNAYYIDNTSWLTGTGRVDNLQGDGIADWTQSSDQTHPSDAGHDYYAQRIAAAIREIAQDF